MSMEHSADPVKGRLSQTTLRLELTSNRILFQLILNCNTSNNENVCLQVAARPNSICGGLLKYMEMSVAPEEVFI